VATITVEDALASVNLAGGLILVASLTRNGRTIIAGQAPDWVQTVITEAAELDWQDDDPDGMPLHATTPLGRLYRITAATPTN
jgi:hypothetical protein